MHVVTFDRLIALATVAVVLGLASLPAAAMADSCQTSRQYSFQRTSQGHTATWHDRTYTYSANVNSMPNKADARKMITAGKHSWDNTYNNCGNGDQNNVSSSYQGNCGAVCPFKLDNLNIVDFGSLSGFTTADSDAIAYTRLRVDANGANYEVDTRFGTNLNQYWHTYSSGTPSGYYDLYGVAAHEAGHAIGMGHTTSACLTMTQGCNNATSEKRTLGKGDIIGMRKLYPSTQPRASGVATLPDGSADTFCTEGCTQDADTLLIPQVDSID